MNSAKKGYLTGEQELLSIIEALKKFMNTLLGQDVKHIKLNIVVADNLSRLDADFTVYVNDHPSAYKKAFSSAATDKDARQQINR